MEEGSLREGLAWLHVPDGRRAAVAQQLEHLEAPFGEQVEGVGRVPLQEEGLVRGDLPGLGDVGEPFELALVEAGEEGAGAQVAQGAVIGHCRSIASARLSGFTGHQPDEVDPPAAMSGSVGMTMMAAGPSSGHLYSQMPQPMQRLATTLGRER